MRKIKRNLPYIVALLLAIAAGVIIADGGLTPAVWLIAAAIALELLLNREGKCEDFVIWKDEYSVGIESIDEDHKKLLNLINNLQAAVMCNTGEEFERQSLNELMDYTHYHFHREEELMRAHGYIDFEGHKGQHDQMIIQAKVFLDRYEEKGRDALPEVTSYLRLWLLQHINVADMKYVPLLKEKGVV